jgi:ADP-heptose:LPS heptosyltransferase
VGFLKRIERLGRLLLVSLLGAVLGVRRRPVCLPPQPRFLVLRLDERLGNLLMLTPLLTSLRRRFPQATIDLLGNARGAALLGSHPALSGFVRFRKKALWAPDGPLRAPLALRGRYDVVIDASNPTDPSATQAIIARLAGARHSIGMLRPGFGRLFSAPVSVPDPNAHEIDLRLALLAPLPGRQVWRETSLGPLPPLPLSSPLNTALASLQPRPYGVVNIGARLPEKRLTAAQYAAVAALLQEHGLTAVLAYGPAERTLAEACAQQGESIVVAPKTDTVELAHLLAGARAVISCDTGPMHLSVSVGTPTLGIFLATDPARYGYPDAPHAAVDARGHGDTPAPHWLSAIDGWLRQHSW